MPLRKKLKYKKLIFFWKWNEGQVEHFVATLSSFSLTFWCKTHTLEWIRKKGVPEWDKLDKCECL